MAQLMNGFLDSPFLQSVHILGQTVKFLAQSAKGDNAHPVFQIGFSEHEIQGWHIKVVFGYPENPIPHFPLNLLEFEKDGR
jgi:hypothetical protein